MFGLEAKASPEGNVSTKPKPDLTNVSAFVMVKINVADCPGATVVGSNLLVRTGVYA